MGRNHSRHVTWALAVMTCLVAFGGSSAYAWDDHGAQARVHAGGQFFHNDPANLLNGSDRVSFGIEGKCNTPSACAPNGIVPVVPGSFVPVPAGGQAPRGNFEYFNHFSGLHAHGRISDIAFGTASPACMAFGP